MKKQLDLLYYVVFSIYCVIYWICETSLILLYPDAIYSCYKFIRVICVIVLFIKVLLEGLSLSQYVASLLLFVMLLMSTIQSGSWNLLLMLVFVLASSHINFNRLAKIMLVVSASITALAVVLSILGYIPLVYIHTESYVYRGAYGFSHPNQLSLCVLSMCIALAVLRFRHFGILDTVFCIACDVLIIVFPKSRTEALCLLFVVVISIVCTLDKEQKRNRLLLSIGCGIVLMSQMISIYLMKNYDSGKNWMYQINKIVSGRIDLANHFYLSYPVKPFGYNYSEISDVWYKGWQGFVVDNAFCHTYLEEGYLVEYVLFALIIVLFLKCIYLNKLTQSMYCLLLFTPVFFCEGTVLYISVNIGLVALNYLLDGTWETQKTGVSISQEKRHIV
ncbi:hypothetical protein D805_0355 [Bifidobacterium thermophilum RBL67]|uniref:Polysaccharide polymerase n=4 Tax=Bifidobacterium TaxID=1678 RepID=M4RQ15_9BIFI|nr:hypothetical protein D805_0355 [Bifidobacterium thermophilum RBL67]